MGVKKASFRRASEASDPFSDEQALHVAIVSVMGAMFTEAMRQGRAEPWLGLGNKRSLGRVAVAVANGGALPPTASDEFDAALRLAERKFLKQKGSGSLDDRLLALGTALVLRAPEPPKRPRGRPKSDPSVGFAVRYANLLLSIVEVVRREISLAGGSRVWPSRCPGDALARIARNVEKKLPTMRFDRLVARLDAEKNVVAVRPAPHARRMRWLADLVDRVSEAMRIDAGPRHDDRRFRPLSFVIALVNETTGISLSKKWRPARRTLGERRRALLPIDFP